MDLHLSIAARTLWQEARGEPPIGQRAVANVIVNRRNSGRWGDTFAEVCLSEYRGVYQFSGWSRTDPNRVKAFRLSESDPAFAALAALIAAAGTEPDPTGGATHYYAPLSVAEPAWVKGDPAGKVPPAVACGKFGNQVFFKGVR